tara:strand:- start:129 stop:425 length:297 start_codon:yes stop_codon:yes gene_type:complete
MTKLNDKLQIRFDIEGDYDLLKKMSQVDFIQWFSKRFNKDKPILEVDDEQFLIMNITDEELESISEDDITMLKSNRIILDDTDMTHNLYYDINNYQKY